MLAKLFSLLLDPYFIEFQDFHIKSLNYRIKVKMMSMKIVIWFFFPVLLVSMYFSYALAQPNLQYKARKSVQGTLLQ